MWSSVKPSVVTRNQMTLIGRFWVIPEGKPRPRGETY